MSEAHTARHQVAHRRLDDQVDRLAGDRLAQDQLPQLKKERLLRRDLAEGIRPSG